MEIDKRIVKKIKKEKKCKKRRSKRKIVESETLAQKHIKFVVSDSENYLNATSYLSLDEVASILKSSHLIKWGQLSDEDKKKTLMQASLMIDDILAYENDKTDETQQLEFPRNGETTIPNNVKYAVCEAIKMSFVGDDAQNVIKEKLGDLEKGYSQSPSDYYKEQMIGYLSKYRTYTMNFNRY